MFYDFRDRIDSVGYLGEGEVAKYGYEYDQADNRTEVRKWVGGTLNNRTFYNNYSGSQKLRNTSSAQGDTATKYTYDAHGNTLTDLTRKLTYRYDYRQMLDTLIHVSVHDANKRDTIIYGYNYLSQRVWKLSRFWYMDDCVGEDPPNEDFFQGEDGGDEGMDGSGGGQMQCPKQWVDLTFYVWSGDEVIAEYYMSDSLKHRYIYANGEMAVSIWRGTNGALDTSFVHHDYLGNARLSTSTSAAMTSVEYFDIWGESRLVNGAARHDYRFIGRERDDLPWEDHHYLRHRYYNPSIGRFLTPDPITSGINPYAYCNQNPVMYNDRSGLIVVWKAVGPVPGLGPGWYEEDPQIVEAEKYPDAYSGPNVPMPEYGDPFGDGPTAGGGVADDNGSTGGGGGGGGGGGDRKKHPAPTNPDGTPKSPEGDVPPLPDGHRWRRVDGSKDRPDKWVPTPPIPGQSQPGVSWDPEGHWDHDSGRPRGRTRWLPDGGGEVGHGNNPIMEGLRSITPRSIVEMGTAAVIIYIVISEGSRVIPVRNLIPVP